MMRPSVTSAAQSTNSNCLTRLEPSDRRMSISSWGWVRERGVSAGTQHRRQREVKAFFSWCRRMDYVEENPFMRVPMVRREQAVVVPAQRRALRSS